MKRHTKTIITLVIVALALTVAIDFFLVDGNELSLAELASDEAVITINERDKIGNITATYTLTKGQGVALQSLLLRTRYLPSSSNGIRLSDNESAYDIYIVFPDQNVFLHLIGSRYLSVEGKLLKILDPDWNTAFQGILAAGQ